MTSADAPTPSNTAAAQSPGALGASAGDGHTMSRPNKRQWWETQHSRRIYSQYALRRLFGYSGYQSIKKRNWTTTSLMLLALGIVSDISEIFGPITKIGLYTSIIAASILGIVILRRLRFRDLCVVPFVLSVIFSVIFGSVALAQNADPTPGDGVIADFVPGVKEIHKVMLNALWEIKKITGNTNKRVIDIQEQLKKQEQQLKEMSERHNQQYDQMLAIWEKESGVPKSALTEHLIKLGAKSEITAQEIPAFLQKFANEYQVLQEKLRAIDMNDAELSDIRRQASADLEIGNFLRARQVLQEARERMRATRQNNASREAALLADEAAIDDLDLDYRSAAAKYLEAADLSNFDMDIATDYKFSAAGILYDLGNEFGNSNALIEAVQLNTDILNYYTRDRVPLLWAVTQNNLGNALAKLGERKGNTRLLDDAIQAYRRALSEYTRNETPLEWGMAQNNLGAALMELSERQGGTQIVEDAIDAYGKALSVRKRDRVPVDWATSKNNIGSAYQELASRTNNPDLLRKAIDAYRDALKEWTPELVPNYWAAAQSNLANALADLGSYESATTHLEEALTVFQTTLEQVDRSRAPIMWGTLQNNMGTTLLSLGRKEENPSRIQQAIDAFRNALEERTLDRVPIEWAITQNNLGKALGNLGWQTGNAIPVEDAIAAHRRALSEITYEQLPLNWVGVQSELGYAFRALGNIAQQSDHFVTSADHFQKILNAELTKIYPNETELVAAEFHQGICWSLIRAIEMTTDLRHLERADGACASAVLAMSNEQTDLRRLDTMYNFAYLKLTVAEIQSDPSLARQALDGFQAIQTDPLSTTDDPQRPALTNEISRAQAALDISTEAAP